MRKKHGQNNEAFRLAANERPESGRVITLPGGETLTFVIESVEFCQHSNYLVSLETDSDDIVSRVLREGGNWISPEMQIVLDNMTANSKVLDLGAHIGSFALPCAVLGAQVVAVESSARNAALLLHSAAINELQNLQVLEKAIWSSHKELFWEEKSSHSHLSLEPSNLSHSQVVEALPLAEILKSAQISTFDVVKLDIEGAEVEALSQSSFLFTPELNPLVIVECNGHRLSRLGRTVQELLICLENLQLNIYRLDGDELMSVDSSCIQIENCVDYLAAKELPHYFQNMKRRPYFSAEELSVLAHGWSFHHQLEHRAYLAATLVAAPPAIKDHPAVQATFSRLAEDPAPEIRKTVLADSQNSGKAWKH